MQDAAQRVQHHSGYLTYRWPMDYVPPSVNVVLAVDVLKSQRLCCCDVLSRSENERMKNENLYGEHPMPMIHNRLITENQLDEFVRGNSRIAKV